MTTRVLITDRFAFEAETALRSDPSFSVHRSAEPLPNAEELQGVHALLIRSRTRIDSQLLDSAPDLKVVITATSGFDHIDLNATTRKGVIAMYTPEANMVSAAELTWSLVLACARRLVPCHKAVKNGVWAREQLVGVELSGRVYGVVGLGRIGRRVAAIAQAFGMQVIGYDPYAEDFGSVQRVSFEELLKQSDVISFHVPKTAETRHMINRSTLEFVNRGAILVNTSRGSVVHLGDLEVALEQGWLRAVGLDVFEKEPLPRSSKLLTFENVITTPHVGATTEEAFAKASLEAASKLVSFFRGETPSDTLPPEAVWYGATGLTKST